jgi:hypothetical protein
MSGRGKRERSDRYGRSLSSTRRDDKVKGQRRISQSKDAASRRMTMAKKPAGGIRRISQSKDGASRRMTFAKKPAGGSDDGTTDEEDATPLKKTPSKDLGSDSDDSVDAKPRPTKVRKRSPSKDAASTRSGRSRMPHQYARSLTTTSSTSRRGNVNEEDATSERRKSPYNVVLVN